jgi:putative membrane protein
MISGRELIVLFAITSAAVLVSGYEPYDRLTWLLEVGPVLIGVPLLFATHRAFPLTRLLYYLLFLHALILILGGHYTYARVPVGFWLQDWLDLARNHYDRLGHVAQGFVPAILAREILIRRSPLLPGSWLFLTVTSICLAFSACYELIEWWAAIIMGQGADSFLGTQGDAWDTQWDMFLALCGAVAAQILLRAVQDRQLESVARASAC